ncbi:hypothetical protein B0H19DRAFT_1080376 [Mycena capillaripes]|nr:hypothetical protein B0H19DRAFT_1080376 [Mycena capillaripes]
MRSSKDSKVVIKISREREDGSTSTTINNSTLALSLHLASVCPAAAFLPLSATLLCIPSYSGALGPTLFESQSNHVQRPLPQDSNSMNDIHGTRSLTRAGPRQGTIRRASSRMSRQQFMHEDNAAPKLPRLSTSSIRRFTFRQIQIYRPLMCIQNCQVNLKSWGYLIDSASTPLDISPSLASFARSRRSEGTRAGVHTAQMDDAANRMARSWPLRIIYLFHFFCYPVNARNEPYNNDTGHKRPA